MGGNHEQQLCWPVNEYHITLFVLMKIPRALFVCVTYILCLPMPINT